MLVRPWCCGVSVESDLPDTKKWMKNYVRFAAYNNNKVRAEVACRLDSLCVALGEQWSVVTMEILPTLVVDADPDVRCEVSA